MSFLGLADKLLNIFEKPLRMWADPSRRIEKELERIEKDRKFLLMQPSTDAHRRLVDRLDVRRTELLKEQARLAARS